MSRRVAALFGAAGLVPSLTACEPPPSLWEAEAVSVAAGGGLGNAGADPGTLAVSHDSMRVAFSSRSTDLVDDGQGGGVFERDLETGTTRRLTTVPAYGLQYSRDDTQLAGFALPGGDPPLVDLVVTDLATGTTRVLVEDVNTSGPLESLPPPWPGRSMLAWGPGRAQLLFNGWADPTVGPVDTQLCASAVPRPGFTYDCFDVYTYDLGTDEVRLVSLDFAGTNGAPTNSFVGGYGPAATEVLYRTQLTQPVPGSPVPAQGSVWVRDLASGAVAAADPIPGPGPAATEAVFAPTSRRVAYTTGAPGFTNVFVRDLDAGTTTLVSTNADGTVPGNQSSSLPSFSPDGSRIAFISQADNLGPADTNGTTDVYTRNVDTGAVELVSTRADCTDSAAGASTHTGFSRDGQEVLLESAAADLGATDTNGTTDVYVHDLATCTNNLVSATPGGTATGDGPSTAGRFTVPGQVVFLSQATNLVAGDANGAPDLFVATLGGADLSVAGQSSRSGVIQRYDLVVTSGGPLTAQDVVLVADVPAGGTPYLLPGGCAVDGEVVVCELGSLIRGGTLIRRLAFEIEGPPGDADVTAFVTSSTPDHDGRDNLTRFPVTLP